MRSIITVIKRNDGYFVDVTGKFGDGYHGASAGDTPEKAALFTLVQKSRYIDTNKEGGDIFAPPEIKEEMEKLKVPEPGSTDNGIVRITLRLPNNLYEKIKLINAETRESINKIITDVLQEKLGE